MHKGIYIALSGAILKQKHMDTFAQNISNAATTGFKKERISFKDYMIPADNNAISGADGRVMSEISKIVTDYSSGSFVKTGNPLDLAIGGEGFFELEGNRYTRNGNFKISDDGYLVTQDGIHVLGGGGPIALEGLNLEINSSGDVYVDQIPVGTISIVDFEDRSTLEKLDGGLFVSSAPGIPVESEIKQGYIEGSNVEVVKELVQMITALREFEAYQKMIRAFDEASAKTINEMGR